MLDRFDELADGLNHPEGVAWNPFDGLIYAGGEGGVVVRAHVLGQGPQIFDRSFIKTDGRIFVAEGVVESP
jgi:hypothetical protein